jgi:hypothetical protein
LIFTLFLRLFVPTLAVRTFPLTFNGMFVVHPEKPTWLFVVPPRKPSWLLVVQPTKPMWLFVVQPRRPIWLFVVQPRKPVVWMFWKHPLWPEYNYKFMRACHALHPHLFQFETVCASVRA